MYQRTIKTNINDRLEDRKIIMVTGPRQVGKTTLIEEILSGHNYLEINGDDMADRLLFDSFNTEKLKNLVGDYKFLFVDEAQKIPNIGDVLKIIYDKIKTIKVLVTGSSSFELNQKINEHLTGRKWEFTLLPISWAEYVNKHGYLTAQKQLDLRLVYGMYPEVLNQESDQEEILKSLTSSYLYKDILALNNLKRPELLDKLLRALAFQVGSEVSYNELAQLLGADKNTISSYIDLLCKAYVIFKLPAFSRNLRNEIKSNQKIYFYDNGIRNIVIGNLHPLGLRNDIGQLWENFLISERYKTNIYDGKLIHSYFWRTTTQREIDYIEEDAGKITAYEFKWAGKRIKVDKEFERAYDAKTELIDKNNYDTFLRKYQIILQ
ncbi:MAG: ATP-binding protein [Saprospiraceae bacterium]|nr:ATP-binding protein [Saprospiraceae bacterium]